MASGVNTENKPVVPVSVVIPCYNSADTIERAIKSIVAQTVLPAEVWIINDGSTDNTAAVLEEIKTRYGRDLNINIIHFSTNKGPSAARNAGWDSATQPYIAFLDADDTWDPKKLEIQYGWMKEHPEVAMTGNRAIWLRDGEKKRLITELILDMAGTKKVTPICLGLSNIFSMPTVMLKRESPFRFPVDKKNKEDYYLWFKLVLSGYDAYKINPPLAYIHKAPYGEKGLTARLWEAEKEELEMFMRLHKEGLLPMGKAYLLGGFSFLKFIRRVLIVWLRNLKNKK